MSKQVEAWLQFAGLVWIALLGLYWGCQIGSGVERRRYINDQNAAYNLYLESVRHTEQKIKDFNKEIQELKGGKK